MLAKEIVIKSVTIIGMIKIRVPAINDQNLKVFKVDEDTIIWLQNQLKNEVYLCDNKGIMTINILADTSIAIHCPKNKLFIS